MWVSHTVIQCLSHLLAMLSSTTTVQMAVAPSSSERKLKLQCSSAFSEINFGSWTKVTSCYIEAAMAGLCDEELHLVDAGCKAYLHFKVLKRDRTLCRDSLSLFWNCFGNQTLHLYRPSISVFFSSFGLFRGWLFAAGADSAGSAGRWWSADLRDWPLRPQCVHEP